jgi:adenylate cyclase class IV
MHSVCNSGKTMNIITLRDTRVGGSRYLDKQLIIMTYKSKREKELQEHHADDVYYQLNGEDQVIIFRLRTGHKRLKYHTYNKLKIDQIDICTCESSKITYTRQVRLIYKE